MFRNERGHVAEARRDRIVSPEATAPPRPGRRLHDRRHLAGNGGKMIELTPSYYRYWGKADRETGQYHLLPYHCLDVAAVGWSV